MSFICSHYLSHFIYYCCFNIVTFVILCQFLSCICLYLTCIFVWDHNRNKCLHVFVSSFYLMYFVFISYVYLYNVLHFILNKCNPIQMYITVIFISLELGMLWHFIYHNIECNFNRWWFHQQNH